MGNKKYFESYKSYFKNYKKYEQNVAVSGFSYKNPLRLVKIVAKLVYKYKNHPLYVTFVAFIVTFVAIDVNFVAIYYLNKSQILNVVFLYIKFLMERSGFLMNPIPFFP